MLAGRASRAAHVVGMSAKGTQVNDRAGQWHQDQLQVIGVDKRRVQRKKCWPTVGRPRGRIEQRDSIAPTRQDGAAGGKGRWGRVSPSIRAMEAQRYSENGVSPSWTPVVVPTLL